MLCSDGVIIHLCSHNILNCNSIPSQEKIDIANWMLTYFVHVVLKTSYVVIGIHDPRA